MLRRYRFLYNSSYFSPCTRPYRIILSPPGVRNRSVQGFEIRPTNSSGIVARRRVGNIVSALLNAEGDPAESNIRRTQSQVHDLDSMAAVLPKFQKGRFVDTKV